MFQTVNIGAQKFDASTIRCHEATKFGCQAKRDADKFLILYGGTIDLALVPLVLVGATRITEEAVAVL